jgi:hypothetical protein
MLTPFILGPTEVLPWLIGSFNSNRFLTRVLLIALKMEAVSTSETLVNLYQSTWRYNPEDSHFHGCIY